MRHIIPISGKDSLATAILQSTYDNTLEYEYFFNPTGAELPEVFDWLDEVENYLEKPILRIGKNLVDAIKLRNYFLPSPKTRYCTHECKIQPMLDYLKNDDCSVYYGIRADETREGFNNKTSPNILPVYPLIKFGIDLKGVYSIINGVNLKPPTFFWKSLYEEVVAEVGSIETLFEEWEIDILFAWRSRSNCYFCFYQRLYELVGLLEHYPDLFDEMERLENKSKFTWKYNYPMTKIRDNAALYREKRKKKIISVIKAKQQRTAIDFSDSEENFVDDLLVKSCGLLCGK